MIKHTLILALSACLAYSQQYGAYGEPQRGKPLHFSDIAKHFDSVTSQSTSLRDLEKVVEPALDKIRRRRSDDDVKDSVRKVVEAGLETAGINVNHIEMRSGHLKFKDIYEKVWDVLNKLLDALKEKLKHLKEKIKATLKYIGNLEAVKKIKGIIKKILHLFGIEGDVDDLL